MNSCNWNFYFPVVFQPNADLLRAQDALLKIDVVPRRYFYPSLNSYRTIVPAVSMPVSESLADRILCLPLYFNLAKDDVMRIVEIIVRT